MSEKQPNNQEKQPPTTKSSVNAGEPSTPETPGIIEIELTPEAYRARKEALIGKHPLKPYIETYFEWLEVITPEEIIDSVENSTSLKDHYKSAPLKWRLAVATARGILKSSARYREQFKKIVTYDLALTTLKYENDAAYQTIVQYGEKGTAYLEQSLKDTMEIFGVVPPNA